MELQLYEGGAPSELAVEVEEQLARDEACARCRLGPHKNPGLRSPCLSGEGDAGGLLLVGESPGRAEDSTGRPFIGKSGQLLRRIVTANWAGSVAYDNAVRCAPGRGKITPTHVGKCRGYLASTVAEGFERIVCLGAVAALSVTGRSVPPFSTRKGYSYLANGTPVFFVLHPSVALRNRFISQWFEEDLAWALTATPPKPLFTEQVLLVGPNNVADAVRTIRAAEWSSFDVETSGRMWCKDFEVISVAVCTVDSERAWVWDRDALAAADVLQPLLDWLGDSTARKSGQNVKYDQLAVMDAFGVEVRGVDGDTRLMRKLLAPDASGALDNMAELVGMGGLKQQTQRAMKKIVATIKRNVTKGVTPLYPGLRDGVGAAIRLGVPPEQFMYGLIPQDDLSVYNARDAVCTTRLVEHLSAALSTEPELATTWRDTVLPAANALVHVEAWGIAVDKEALRAFGDHLDSSIVKAAALLDQYGDVNWNSPPQIRELLYKQLKLPVAHYTATGQPSTDAKSLERLAKKHALPRALLDYRTLTKLKGTYAEGMWQHIRDDARIHPNVKLDGAASGRTSCVQPNLQNIPRATSALGKMARDVFVASDGCVLLELDYSQLELRVAAMLSGDKLMRAIFEEGVDYHQRTAELVSEIAWGIAPELVTSEHRSQAKAINFGVLYGMGDKALAARIGCSIAQAGRVRESILGKMKSLDRWCKLQLRETRRSGYTWTHWDGERARRRPLYKVADSDSESRSRAEHGAWNTPVQGTASDFCVRSLGECVEWIIGDAVSGVKLVLSVHDSLLFDVREDMALETLATVRAIMISWPSYGVPLVVDAKWGRSWGSMEDV